MFTEILFILFEFGWSSPLSSPNLTFEVEEVEVEIEGSMLETRRVRMIL